MPSVKGATWHITAERVAALEAVGFEGARTAQTLTRHHMNASRGVEAPRDGLDSGDYVAIVARRA